MLKKPITYEDFNGDTVTEDFYFNLSRAELVELELSHEGGLAASIKKIIDAENGAEIIAEFKKLILKAYGKKSGDGRRFIKNRQLREEFESSEAYSVLFMELVTDAEAAAVFVNGIVPQGLVGEDEKLQHAILPIDPIENVVEIPKAEPKKLTRSEILEMDADELKSGIATGRYIF